MQSVKVCSNLYILSNCKYGVLKLPRFLYQFVYLHYSVQCLTACVLFTCPLQSSGGPPYHVFYCFKERKISFVKCSNSGKLFGQLHHYQYQLLLKHIATLSWGTLCRMFQQLQPILLQPFCRECTCGTFRTGCWWGSIKGWPRASTPSTPASVGTMKTSSLVAVKARQHNV